VLTGKAKFGIFGDGKELAQLCLAKQFMDGDYRSGYYRDQTIMLALGEVTLQEYYAQLFSDTNVENEPHSAGRQMNCHYGTRFVNDDGTWKDMTKIKITTTDLSPTAAQMPRIMGLGLASKLFREDKNLHQFKTLSDNGNEIVFGTIGDGSTSEGIFLEAINAMGVLQIPVVMSIWDDGHAISVPVEKQTTKGSISEALKGFAKENGSNGIVILKARGWNYPELCSVYDKAAKIARNEHTPVMVHVIELTQPQGHSTSGSHERYKSKKRLEWEKEYDCILQFKKWILENNWANEAELDEVHKNTKKSVREAKNNAWKNYITPLKQEFSEVLGMIDAIAIKSRSRAFIKKHRDELTGQMDIYRNYMISAAKKVLRLVRFEDIPEEKQRLADWLNESKISNYDRYNSLLYAHGEYAALSIKEVKPTYASESNLVDGRIVIRENFDAILASNPKVSIFGEDTGKIGGVNQGCEGLQEIWRIKSFRYGYSRGCYNGKGFRNGNSWIKTYC
jgi:TPP-dependent pyruvate/acetoin dehydrogenase alpha subunit